MTNEELNTALYEKMFAEQEAYRAWLLSQPPAEILKHTYEYTVREDILLALEYHDLPDARAKALLASPAHWPMCFRIGRAKIPAIWTTSGRLSKIGPKPRQTNNGRQNRSRPRSDNMRFRVPAIERRDFFVPHRPVWTEI